MPARVDYRLLPAAMRLTLGALLLACTTASAATLTGQVVGIADGDTLTLLTADKAQHRIRIDGIDAPERTQPYSQRSRQSLAELAHEQRAVADCQKVDRYQRKVCVVRVKGQDIGLAQVRRGLAWHFKRYEAEQAPEDRDAYAAAEREARSARRGLWLDPAPVAPWEFRAAHPAVETQPSPVSNVNGKTARDARCAWIEKAIESIDAQARQPQTAVTQDRLREDRRKLADERYALKC